jgi:PD-(D/E)XK endonuclease
MDSNTKGAIAEQAIVLAATKLHIPVLRPVNEHGRIDLALEVGGRLLRVQVKWGRLAPARDVVIVSLVTSRCTTHGHVRQTYTDDEIDLFAVYCGDLDRCFVLPAQLLANRTCVYLRLTPPRNGQQSCINLADDFTFDGAVAQLARAMRWQRIGQGFESPQLHLQDENDSSALTAPNRPLEVAAPGPVEVNADTFRGRLGHWIDRVAAGESLLVSRRGKAVMRVERPVS